jgi:kinesin family protein 11
VNAQREEANKLREELTTASELAMQSNSAVSSKLDEVLREEREQAAADRQNLLSQITSLVRAQGEVQDARLGTKIEEVRTDVTSLKEAFEASQTQYSQGMDTWNEKEGELVEEVLRSRETLKSKLKEDWVVSSRQRMPIKHWLINIRRLQISTTLRFKLPPSLSTKRQFVLWMSK